MNKSFTVGIGAAVLLNTLNGWQDVYRATAFREYGVFFLTGFSMLFTAIVYSLTLKFSTGKAGRISVRQACSLNIWTVGSWGGIFFSLSTLPPVLVISLIAASTPVTTYWLDRRQRQASKINNSDLAIALTNAALIILLFTEKLLEVKFDLSNDALVGLIACLIVVVSDAQLIVHMKKLSEANVSSHQQLAVRFYLLAAIGIAIGWHENQIVFTENTTLTVITIAILGILPGTLLLQACVKHLEPVLVEVLLSTTPIFVLFFQFIKYSTPPTMIQMTACIMISALSALHVHSQINKN
jgi:hypothetical protein